MLSAGRSGGHVEHGQDRSRAGEPVGGDDSR